MNEKEQPEKEQEEKEIVVKRVGCKKHPHLLVDHEGVRKILLAEYYDISLSLIPQYIDTPRGTATARSLLRFGTPFTVEIVDDVSNSGLHTVESTTRNSALYEKVREDKFPYRGTRLSMHEIEETLNKEYPPSDYIAWSVSSGVDEVWELGYAGHPRESVLVRHLPDAYECLQGNLRYTEVSFDAVASKFQETLFNHTFEPSLNKVTSFFYNDAIYLIVEVDNSITVKSDDHETSRLGAGKYVLMHPIPQPQID